MHFLARRANRRILTGLTLIKHILTDLMNPSILRRSLSGKRRWSFFAKPQQNLIPSPAISQWHFGVNSIVMAQVSWETRTVGR
jgi:hypothetical protein